MKTLKKIIKTTALTMFYATLAFSKPDDCIKNSKERENKIQKNILTIIGPSITIDPQSKKTVLPGNFNLVWNYELKNGDSFKLKGGYNYDYNNTKDVEDKRKTLGTITEKRTGSIEAEFSTKKTGGIFGLKGNLEAGNWKDTNYNTIHKGKVFGDIINFLEVERLYNFTKTFTGVDLSCKTLFQEIILNPHNTFCKISWKGDIYGNLILGSLTNKEDIKSKVIFYEQNIKLPRSTIKNKFDFLNELCLEGREGLTFLFDKSYFDITGKIGVKTNIGTSKQIINNTQKGAFNSDYPYLKEIVLSGYNLGTSFGFGGKDKNFSHLSKILYEYQEVIKGEKSKESFLQLKKQEHLWKFFQAFNYKKLNFIIGLSNKIENNYIKINNKDNNINIQGSKHITNPFLCFIYGLDSEGIKRYMNSLLENRDKKPFVEHSFKPYLQSTSSIEDIISRISNNILFLVGFEGSFNHYPNISYVLQENLGLMENKDYSFSVKGEIFANILGMAEEGNKSPLLGIYTSAKYLYNNSSLEQIKAREEPSIPLTANIEERLEFATGFALGNFKGHEFRWYFGLESKIINIQRGPEGRYNITTGIAFPITLQKD